MTSGSLKTVLFVAALIGVAYAAPATSSGQSSLVARCDTCNDIPGILNALISTCTDITADLKAAINGNVLVELSLLQPYILQVATAVNLCVSQLNSIANLELTVLLAGLDVHACAQLTVDAILSVCAVLQLCLEVVGVLEVTACLSVILYVSTAIVALLNVLVNICVSIGLKAAICACINADIHIGILVNSCGLASVLSYLSISL